MMTREDLLAELEANALTTAALHTRRNQLFDLGRTMDPPITYRALAIAGHVNDITVIRLTRHLKQERPA